MTTRMIVLLFAAACGRGGESDTDQSTGRTTSDYPPNGSAKGFAGHSASAPTPVAQGTSDTSTNSGTYNTGRSTTKTRARLTPRTP